MAEHGDQALKLQFLKCNFKNKQTPKKPTLDKAQVDKAPDLVLFRDSRDLGILDICIL